jgi:RNA polymerase sigma-70 factor (ECF subfamily)
VTGDVPTACPTLRHISGPPRLPSDRASSEDGPLLAAAKTGDRAALESLVCRYYDRCYGVCRRLLGSEQDALDATQEAMIAITRGLAGFDGRSALSTWVYRIATNTALDELRRRGRRPLLERAPVWDDHASPFDDIVADPFTDEVGESATARLSLDCALEQLSDEHRAAVVLRDMLDLEYAEIADVLGVPIGTVRSRIARGRLALAQALEPHVPPGSGGQGVTTSQRNRAGFDDVQG